MCLFWRSTDVQEGGVSPLEGGLQALNDLQCNTSGAKYRRLNYRCLPCAQIERATFLRRSNMRITGVGAVAAK